ncbi:MAG: anti-sigma factor [Candidatus Dormibacteria bacterium]
MNVHSQVDGLLGAYALGAVTSDEAELVRDHVVACDGCAEALGRLAETAAALSLAVDDVPAPRGLRERVLAAARADEAAMADETASAAGMIVPLHGKRRLMELAMVGRFPTTWSRRARISVFVPAAAAAAVLVSLGGWNLNLQHQLDLQGKTQPVATTIEGEIRGAAGSHVGTITYMPQQKLALVSLHALATPADGRAYELWLLRPGQRAQPVVVFRPEADGNKVLVVPTDISSGELAITVEPIGGSLQPSSDPIAVGRV